MNKVKKKKKPGNRPKKQLLISSQCISLSCQSMDSLATDSVLVTNIFVEQRKEGIKLL